MKTIEQLEKELAEAKQENALLNEVNKELTLEIEAGRNAPVEDLIPGLVSKLSFDYNDATYGFALHGVNHNGKVISIADVIDDKALQAHLVKIKSGMIAEIAK